MELFSSFKQIIQLSETQMGRIIETVAQSTQSKETENASQQLYSTVLYLLKFCNLVIYIDFAIF